MVTKPNGQSYPKSLPVGEYRLLGEITSEGPQFDCSELITDKYSKERIEKSLHQEITDTLSADLKPIWERNYFTRILESNGIYLKNPMGNPLFLYVNPEDFENHRKWESYESKRLKEGEKYIALLKVQ